jgi:Lsr2
MAQKITTILLSDLDGGDADETVYFALDGTDYEIDLSADQAAKLRKELVQYVTHARKAAAGGQAPLRRRRQQQAPGKAKKIREWARSRGMKVNDVGRIPASMEAEYDAAHA